MTSSSMKLPKRAFYTKNHVSLSESNADKHQESEMGNGKVPIMTEVITL